MSRSPLSSCSRNSQKDVAVTEADLHHSAVPDERNQTFFFLCELINNMNAEEKYNLLPSWYRLKDAGGTVHRGAARPLRGLAYQTLGETYKLTCI